VEINKPVILKLASGQTNLVLPRPTKHVKVSNNRRAVVIHHLQLIKLRKVILFTLTGRQVHKNVLLRVSNNLRHLLLKFVDKDKVKIAILVRGTAQLLALCHNLSYRGVLLVLLMK